MGQSTVISTINQNKTMGFPARTQGLRVGYIEIPPGMSGTAITLMGSFDGFQWFPINGESGPVSFLTKVTADKSQTPDHGMFSDGKLVPVNPPNLLDGFQFITAVSNQNEDANRNIKFHLVPGVGH
jgi:hypothetical protein